MYTKYWAPEIETLDRETLNKVQLILLKKTLKSAY